MVKKLILVVVLICLSCSIFALDMSNAEAISEGELPKWTLQLRRSEIIFFGSLPITYPVTTLVLNKVFKANDMTFWQKFGIACSVSGAITIADYVIGRVQSK